MLKKKNKNKLIDEYSRWNKPSYKYVACSKCGVNNVQVSNEAIGGICWSCCQHLIEPPISVIRAKQEAEGAKKPRKSRGWQFMAVYVDEEGNVYHKGVEQPELKGTLPPTPRKEYKRKTIHERIKEQEEKREKLIKLYQKARRAKLVQKDNVNKIKKKK